MTLACFASQKGKRKFLEESGVKIARSIDEIGGLIKEAL